MNAWQTYDILAGVNHDNTYQGPVAVYVSTNDDDDDGYPDGRVESWTLSFPTVEEAIRYTGTSRTGISGVRVTVRLNGEEVTRWPRPEQGWVATDTGRAVRDKAKARPGLDVLEARVEALTEALRQIAEYDSDEAIFYVDIARAALDGKETT